MLTTESRREESPEMETEEVHLEKLQKAKKRVEKKGYLALRDKKESEQKRPSAGRKGIVILLVAEVGYLSAEWFTL